MKERFIFGFVFLAFGTLILLMTMTKRGRNLTRGYNRLPLPARIRKGPVGDSIANFLAGCAGVMLSIVGMVVLIQAVYCLISGAPCQ